MPFVVVDTFHEPLLSILQGKLSLKIGPVFLGCMGENAYKFGGKTTSHSLKLRFRILNPTSYLEFTKIDSTSGNDSCYSNQFLLLASFICYHLC
uniref:Uncharacterized protein n=1 Tax=Onchocerca volvulus TaxID=6282 RepID=A0A8R1TSX9_ONCVO